jgi:predicted MFS family arabinose efflux permease
VLVRSVFHGGPAAFSIAVAAFGVGGLLGGGGLLAVGPGAERRRISTTFAVLQGAAIVATALTPVFALVPLLLIGAGAAMTVTNTAANALLQTAAEPHLLGRTVSLYMLAMRGGIALGALLTGVSVSLLGVRSALLIDGVAAIVLQVGIGWWWWLQPSGSSTATGS